MLCSTCSKLCITVDVNCFLAFWLQTQLKTFGPVKRTVIRSFVIWIQRKSITLATDAFCIVQLKSPALQLSAGLLQWNLSVNPGCDNDELPLLCIFHRSYFLFSSRMQHALLWLPEMSARPRYVSASFQILAFERLSHCHICVYFFEPQNHFLL